MGSVLGWACEFPKKIGVAAGEYSRQMVVGFCQMIQQAAGEKCLAGIGHMLGHQCKLVRLFRPVLVLNLIYSLFFLNFFYSSEWVAGTLLQNVYTSAWTNEPPTTWLG